MTNSTLKLNYIYIVLFCLLAQPVLAGKVYQWIDEEGTVHFSDIPPSSDEIVETKEIIFADYADADNASDEFSIINQLETMTEWRKQLTDERLAKRQMALEEQRLNDVYVNEVYPEPPRTVYNASPNYLYPYSYNTFKNYNRRINHHHGGFKDYPQNKHGRFHGGRNSHKLKSYKLVNGF